MKRMWSKNELLRMSDAEIRKLIESGEIGNAKPIFWHGMEMFDSVGQKNILYFHILNNSSEQINSKEKLFAFLDSVEGNVYIQCIGAIEINGNLLNVYTFVKTSEATIQVIGKYAGVDTYAIENLAREDFGSLFNFVNDNGTNKIN